ncbi:MAG: MazG family protein [Pseudomonadota bacterium]|jgi:ATP diphosphatase
MTEKPNHEVTALQNLLRVMAMLRDRQHGCPWDLEQTMESLTRYTLEEVYEVVDTIERKAMDHLCDELGDLLFQVVFYARIAEEEGRFDFSDVAQAITDKLLRRHPHVFPDARLENFGQPQALNADSVVVNWEAIKAAERAAKGASGAVGVTSVLADIPLALPALERALKLQSRAAKQGFDWDEVAPVMAKLREELDELDDAIASGQGDEVRDELGDVLFAAVNLARHLKLDPETSLRQANRKFERRFNFIENQLQQQHLAFADVTQEEMDQYWEQAKRAE